MQYRLSDPSLLVRSNTLQVLTHLLLNDMIKLKGHVKEIVLCLLDKDAQIRDRSNLFFRRLSERSQNPLLNLLSDIIGSLSLQTSVEKIENNSNSSETAVETMDLCVEEGTFESTSLLANQKESQNIRWISEKDFQIVMEFLLSFVKKEK